MAAESAPTAIVYHSLGSNHQLPPEYLRKAEGMYYIHSIENWDEIERGLLAVRAEKMLAQSRLLRVSGQQQDTTHDVEKRLNVDIVTIPGRRVQCDVRRHRTGRCDGACSDGGQELCRPGHRCIGRVFRGSDAGPSGCGQIMQRHAADAITIECLFLKHRKPCLSFALNNGELVPCGCENHLDATLTLMLGRWLLERAGFLHNPEFDTSENRYLGAHCTCAWKLHGPQGSVQEYLVRPFFHQLPKTPRSGCAMDTE